MKSGVHHSGSTLPIFTSLTEFVRAMNSKLVFLTTARTGQDIPVGMLKDESRVCGVGTSAAELNETPQYP